jgi:hypothetical protein
MNGPGIVPITEVCMAGILIWSKLMSVIESGNSESFISWNITVIYFQN